MNVNPDSYSITLEKSFSSQIQTRPTAIQSAPNLIPRDDIEIPIIYSYEWAGFLFAFFFVFYKNVEKFTGRHKPFKKT